MQRNIHKAAAVILALVGIAAAQIQPFARTPSKPVGIAKLPGEIPSGSVPSPCKPFVNKGPNAAYWLIDCYLSHPSNQGIANSIAWSFNNQSTSWAQWPAWAKDDLVNTFKDTVAWYKGGMELNLTYPSPWVMNLYCSDTANGKDHATGRVFNDYFKQFYTLADLENAGLWTLLDWKLLTYPCQM